MCSVLFQTSTWFKFLLLKILASCLIIFIRPKTRKIYSLNTIFKTTIPSKLLGQNTIKFYDVEPKLKFAVTLI